YEQDGKLYISMYTPDNATVKACASCHSSLTGKTFKVGDLLGIRGFRTVFSDDVAVGRAELNANLEEYETARKIFEETLEAAKNGGRYPLDLNMTKYATMNPITDPQAVQLIDDGRKHFTAFTRSVDKLLESQVGSIAYRKAQQEIVENSNRLRKTSNGLVQRYSQVSSKNQENIRTSIIISSLISLILLIGIAWFLTKLVILPIQRISGVLDETSRGNLDQEKLAVNSQDEVGMLSH
ncbi:MAG: hypothetical protein GWM98_17075, partial [Nitrospinaceae bacterium]|nr:hypothetical protein [Nitrospinaceae bacterium]NIR55890.1 hypothetical protein [Nitrospinaceae bacterium]NIS86336.1 hypothetical protein [Nitrospinaceae bacterium]NIT83172.1 hypothetical protein [Nitrospinaceae bacterium]NIU45381.1 hypothetical protein [Nitrospinaceae bacterium]